MKMRSETRTALADISAKSLHFGTCVRGVKCLVSSHNHCTMTATIQGKKSTPDSRLDTVLTPVINYPLGPEKSKRARRPPVDCPVPGS
jgi:hypothetical protein